MNNRERALAILNYQDYDRLPVVHFGFWNETLIKWFNEGHLEEEEAKKWTDGNTFDKTISKKLGFDFNWYSCYTSAYGLFPGFKSEIVETLNDGTEKVRNGNGVIVLRKKNAGSIPAEVDHLLKDRESWEKYYLPKLIYSDNRINFEYLNSIKNADNRETPLGLHCGSLFGEIRNWLGLEGSSYLLVDDEDLYDEIINVVGELSYNLVKNILATGAKFDFGHFWEDICFKNGPLVIPSVFDKKVGPHYKRITDLLKANDINIISLDCDGLIDSLIPTWFENGVNTMFPIEVGTWGANIRPWREKYGKELRGVGGMDKKVFAYDYKAIDLEIERLKPLIDLGGYIPCPDHRIAPDAKWENVQYYCEQMHKMFT
ncbi:MAG: uroporphyrinogen decarboxylase family protein [Bacillota bacterium]|nr:uroporphyrinogen decarboxylase family protein [Bacillota bacterium]